MIEVEIKMKTDNNDYIVRQLLSWGFSLQGYVRETDTYYTHPGYDVKKHDKALRIRRTEDLRSGSVSSFLTYKGPKLDKISMSREEIEMPIPDAEAMQRILTGVGFIPMIPVEKTRQYLELSEIHACADDVAGLGSFLELEILADTENERAGKLQKIENILQQLGLSMKDTVTVSYLSMLQETMHS